MNDLISVIVPVFKVEPFLVRCIESVRNQTYKNIEIILVDDGSPDRCPEICDTYKQRDARIRVIHKENGGLSDARNAGSCASKGEYLCFVDSDDYMQPTMVEHLVNAAVCSGAKLAVANFQVINERGERIFPEGESPIQTGVYSAEELIPRFYQNLGWYYIVAWNKLYHRSLFEQIRFPLGKIHEDEYIIPQIMWLAKKIACVGSEEYMYIYQRKGGIMSSRQVQSHCDWLEALYLRFEFFKQEKGVIYFASQTRAVYFRELTHLFLVPDLFANSTLAQRKKAMQQYHYMDGKTITEKINWFLFRISPKLDNMVVQKTRKLRR